MFQYVTDRDFLRQTKCVCADLINQLVQELKEYGIDAKQSLVGSGRRGLITRNGDKPIDYDYNLEIWNVEKCGSVGDLKGDVFDAFDDVLRKNGYRNCEDSTSSITSKAMRLASGNQTPFKIDIAIVRVDRFGNCYRLIHKKTGCVQEDEYIWNQSCNMDELRKKEEFLKAKHWDRIQERYLDLKNHYLCNNDYNHPSFVCYTEAVNNVYNEVRQMEGYGVQSYDVNGPAARIHVTVL